MKEKLNEYVLMVRDIKYAYGHDHKKEHAIILDIPCWTLEKGKSVFLHGESGSGKSTLLNLLSGMLLSKNGEINIAGTNLAALNAQQRDRFRAEHIGVVFQQFNLIPYLTVIDNVLLAANFASGLSPEIEQKAKELFAQVNLPESLYQQKAMSLSIGQQQRVAIARAFITRPKILFADEPTGNLDRTTGEQVESLLFELNRESATTLVLVTHDERLADRCDRRFKMTDGTLQEVS